VKNNQELVDHLMNIKPGKYEMLLARNVSKGLIKMDFRNGLSLQVDYSPELFPTIGIWWNNSGYPDEEGLRRCECAFEPIPGSNSSLAYSFNEGMYLKTDPGESFTWEINWAISQFQMNNNSR